MFLLGNGFSQGFGFPGMADLWNTCLKPNQNYYKSSLEEAKQRYPLSYFISKGIGEIELALTVWRAYYESHEIDMFSNAHTSGRGHFEDYIENLCGWLHQYTVDKLDVNIFNGFQRWLRKIKDKYEITFLTTNYDLLLEKAIIANSFKYHFLESQDIDSMPIRKFHGSISWFSSSQPILRQYDGFVSNSFFEKKDSNSYVYDFSKDCLTFPHLAGIHMQLGSQVRSDNVVPIATIIPPTIGKKYNDFFGSIINLVKEDFKNLDYFIIIGYSFPEADPVVRDVIINFYNKNKNNDTRAICINDSETVCDKMEQLFGKEITTIKERWCISHLENLLI